MEFGFSEALETEKPDDAAHPLKSVDFWVRYPRLIWLIEVKDPEGTPFPYQSGQVNDSLAKLKNGDLINEHLLPKIYGVFAYLAQNNRVPRGRVRYGIVIGIQSLTASDRSVLTDKLQRTIDKIGPRSRYGRYDPLVEVHNVESWNRVHPGMAITRHP